MSQENNTIKQGEKVAKTTTIEGMIVKVQRSVKVKETDKVATKVNWTLDFTNCPQETLVELASRTVVIDLQREFRVGKITADGTFEIPLQTNRKTVDPVKKAENALAGLTQEQVKELLAKLK